MGGGGAPGWATGGPSGSSSLTTASVCVRVYFVQNRYPDVWPAAQVLQYLGTLWSSVPRLPVLRSVEVAVTSNADKVRRVARKPLLHPSDDGSRGVLSGAVHLTHLHMETTQLPWTNGSSAYHPLSLGSWECGCPPPPNLIPCHLLRIPSLLSRRLTTGGGGRDGTL